MAILVRPSGHRFKLKIKAGDEEVVFTLKQLTYQQKGHIQGLTTTVKSGQVNIDTSLTCFYNLKYAVKEIKGIEDENGKPYKLRFEEDGSLEDDCVDELLGTLVSDQLQYAALALSENRYPDKVMHPVLETPIEGVEVIPQEKLKTVKKKSSKA